MQQPVFHFFNYENRNARDIGDLQIDILEKTIGMLIQ